MKIPVTDRALTPNTSLVHFRRAIVFGEAQECKDICRTIERTFAAYFGAENYAKYKASSRDGANAVNPSEKKSKGFSTAIHSTTALTKGAQVTEPSAAMPSPLFYPPTIESSATTVAIVCPEARRSSGVDPSRESENVDVGATFRTLTSLQDDLEKDKIIDFDPAFDVIVVIARVNDSYAMNRAAAFAKYHGEKNNNKSVASSVVMGKMLIVTNAVSKEHVLASVAPLNNPPAASSRKWLTSIAVSEHLSPPSFYPEEVPEFKTRLRGPLENICLGVALGVSRHLSVNASTYVAVAPMDLVFAVSFTALSLSLARRIPHGSSPSPNRLLVEIGNPNEGLVWGMVGEYAIDYYGRYQQAIGRVMPNLFTDDPTINFHIHFHDVWNYGIHLMHPVTLYRARLGTNTRNQLANMENSMAIANTPGASQKMRGVLNKIDDVEDELAIANPVQRLNAASVEAMKKSAEISFKTVKNVVMASRNKGKSRSPSPNGPKRSNNNSADDALLTSSSSGDFRLYNFIVSMITSDAHLSPLLPFVSVGWVKWERYMKSICVGVLAFSGRHILSMPAEAVNKLPNPTMMFHNDFAFCGEERAPEPNMRLRQFFPDLFWVLRSGQQPSGQQVAVAPGKRRLVAILAQPQVQLMMSQIAKEQNVNKHQVEQRAERILRQVGDNMNQTDMRLAGVVVRKVFQALYERININSDAYDVLFKAFRKPRTCVVVIPAHRSYIDFMFLGYMLLTFGFQPPHAASGEDFLRLGPLANLLRGSGAFFMRRTFRGDRLYSGLFKEYVRHLVRDAQCIEFFVEGLRSRTGKTIAPKVGFLKMITDAFFEKQEEVDDVLFVPISLSYDKLLEGNIYANELMGIPKPKETMGNLIKSASVLKDKYGALNIVVGEPISLVEMNKDPFATPEGYAPIPKNERVALRVPSRPPPSAAPAIPPSGMGLSATGSVAGPSGSNTPARVLASLAWRITYDIQQRLVVTPTAIISAVLMSMVDHTRLRVSGTPLSMVSNNVEWLRTKVLHKGGNMDSRFAGREASELVTYAINLLSPSVTLSSLSTVYVEDTITTKMLLSMYANQLIHVFADEAILCVCAFAFGREQLLEAPESVTSVGNATNGSIQGNAVELGTSDYCIPLGELRKRARRLQNLMSNELPNFQAASPVWFESWLNVTLEALVEDGAVAHLPLSDADDEEVRFRLCQLSSFSAHQLYQYIESFFITLASAIVFIPTPAAVVIASASGGSATPPPPPTTPTTSATEITTAPPAFPVDHTSSSASSLATTKIQDAQLQRLAHEGSLELFRKKMTDYPQCSSKENIKNCVAKIEELGLFTRDVSPAVTFIVRKSHYDDLRVCLEEVNAMRWHPSGPVDLERIVSELKHVYVTKVAISNTKL